jgi:hypothetical protein
VRSYDRLVTVRLYPPPNAPTPSRYRSSRKRGVATLPSVSPTTKTRVGHGKSASAAAAAAAGAAAGPAVTTTTASMREPDGERVRSVSASGPSVDTFGAGQGGTVSVGVTSSPVGPTTRMCTRFVPLYVCLIPQSLTRHRVSLSTG